MQGAGPDLGQLTGVWDEAALLAVAVFCVHLLRLPGGQVPRSPNPVAFSRKELL